MSERQIRSVLTEMESCFGDSAQFNSKSVVRHDQYDYGEAFLKFHGHLAASLIASKEVLLLVSDYAESQTRTITAVQARLKKNGDRVEAGLAVVAHRSGSTGSKNFRRWGREQGITVLAVDYQDDLPNSDTISELLLEELYTYDRFDLTGPVRTEHDFFGRSFLHDYARRLAGGGIQALFGMRKVGKTSLINRIHSDLLDHHHCRCAVIDASHDDLWQLDAASLMKAITDEARDSTSRGETYRRSRPERLKSEISAAAESDNLLDVIGSDQRPFVLFIDEIDYVTPSSPVGPHWRSEFNPFFRALRRAYQEAARSGPVFSIVLSGVSNRWFTEETVDGIENAALALAPEGFLQPLERSESVHMIRTLASSTGLIMTDRACNIIAETASDNPFWIRKAGSYIQGCYTDHRPVKVTVANTEQLCGEFIEVDGAQLAHSSIRHLFRIYPDLGRAAMDAVRSQKRDIDQQLLSYLGRYGILGEGMDPSGPMVAAGLNRWIDQDSEEVLGLNSVNSDRHTPMTLSSSTGDPDEEWLSMIAEVSSLRNREEKRLRDLTLTVVRSECKDGNRQPTDVFCAAIPRERRAEFEGMGASQILKRIYWLDLINIIKKNWPWFQKIFSDRSTLDLYASIANDRPDAHAKDLDYSELALQRRALNWFAEAIDRSGLL